MFLEYGLCLIGFEKIYPFEIFEANELMTAKEMLSLQLL